MRYFGSKAELFSHAACLQEEAAAPDSPEELTEYLLDTLTDRLTQEPTAALAMLRSMLTHPEAADAVRTSLGGQLKGVQEVISADDAAVRSGLVSTILLGVVIGRVLLELDELTAADPAQIRQLLRPCVRLLVNDLPTG